MFAHIKNTLLYSFIVIGSVTYSADKHTQLQGIDWDINPRVINEDHIDKGLTIVCHGFGGNGNLADYLSTENIIPGALLTYEMVDSTAEGALPLSKANFGQKDDTKGLAALFVYAYHHFPHASWHLYLLSRGGATGANTIAQLVSYNTYAAHLQAVGMTEERATKILSKLKAGTLIFDRPLHSVSSVIKNKVEELLSSSLQRCTRTMPTNATSYIPWFIKDLGSLIYSVSRASTVSSVDCVSLPVVTRGNYVPWGDTPLSSATHIKPLDLNILIHIQNPDDVLGNDPTVAEFCTTIRGINTNFFVGTGVGHNGFNKKIINTFHAFRNYYTDVANLAHDAYAQKIFIEKNKEMLTQWRPNDQTLTDLITRKEILYDRYA